MPELNLQSVSPSRTPPVNLEDFVRILRSYKLSTILNTGTHLLWELARGGNPLAAGPTDITDYQSFYHMAKAYTPRILMLALATCNEFRQKEILTPREFYPLCNLYLGIPCSISDQSFLAQEARAIAQALRAQTQTERSHGIPQQYIQEDAVREACTVLFISRGVGIQHQSHLTSMEELYRDYEILSLMDRVGDDIAKNALNDTFGLSALHIIRSGMCLFSMALQRTSNGVINFNTMGFHPSVTDTLEVDPTTCRTVADLISIKESTLRNGWYESQVCPVEEMYQQYVPDPLYKQPLVHRDKGHDQNQFLIPNPFIFVRGFRQAIFSPIYNSHRGRGEVGRILGDAIAGHIQSALEHIFGRDAVEMIGHDGEKADYHIKLSRMDLIVEIKTHIADFTSTSVMSPSSLPKVWGQIYKACRQCSASIRELPTNDKLKVAMVVVADHMTAESVPFQVFAERSGMFTDMGLHAVEFVTWTGIENALSQTSIRQFEESLLTKWASNYSLTIGNVMHLSFERDKPAHSYEYLTNAKQAIFTRQV